MGEDDIAMNHKSYILRILPFSVLVLGLLIAWGVSAGATGAKNKEMTRYLLISPHTPEQCLGTLDAVEAMPGGKAELAKWEWGCMSGDHTGYRIVTASSADEALKLVPEDVRSQAKAVKLNTFTAAQIQSFHETKK
jgi:hypothetical protein